jgi:hypothetical protein
VKVFSAAKPKADNASKDAARVSRLFIFSLPQGHVALDMPEIVDITTIHE